MNAHYFNKKKLEKGGNDAKFSTPNVTSRVSKTFEWQAGKNEQGKLLKYPA